MYALRRRLDDGPQAGLAVPERVFHAFALIYVVDQDVPTENVPAGTANGKPTHLKPTIRAGEPSEARLEVIWLTRCELCSEDLHHAREVLWVNRIVGFPLVELLECLTAVFGEWFVYEIDLTHRCQSSDEPRNAAQDQACIEVACTSCRFCPLTFHGKVFLQRLIGFDQFSRPARDEFVELLRDSLLFAHGAFLTACRRQPASPRPRDTRTPTGCVSLPTIVHETLVLGRCRYLRPMDSQRVILCNSHMNTRSTLTRRRSLQVLATSLLAPFAAARQRKRRVPSHNVGRNRGAQRWA